MSTALSDLTPDTAGAIQSLLDFARSHGLNPVIQSTRRECGEQNTLYAQGRTTPGPVVTQVAGCRSWHVMGRAADIYIGSESCADYAPLGAYWKSIGGRWGGDFSFKDCVHFELPHPDFTLEELCPNPGPGACEASVRSAPGVAFASPKTLAIFGAAFGAAVGMVLAARR